MRSPTAEWYDAKTEKETPQDDPTTILEEQAGDGIRVRSSALESILGAALIFASWIAWNVLEWQLRAGGLS